MTFGFFARHHYEQAAKNAPPRKFLDGDRVRGEENVALLFGKKMISVEGNVVGAEYTTARSPIDLDWQYKIIDDEQKRHLIPEKRLELVSLNPENLNPKSSVENG